MAGPALKKRKKSKRTIPSGKVYVHASFNNTIVTVTDLIGNVLTWDTAGKQGFKGSRKSTPYAATVATAAAVNKAVEEYGLQNVDIFINGPGPGRDSAVRAVGDCVKKVFSITDITGMPHNGCRPENERRV